MSESRALGRAAYEAGEMRIVPQHILVEQGAEAAREWYRGWDAANLAAPVPDFTECESCGYFTLTFLGMCTNLSCRKPKAN